MNRYLDDDEIAGCYRDAKITVDHQHTWVELEFPHSDDGDFLDSYMVNNYIIYSHTGRIAFDHWMPEELYNKVCNMIWEQVPPEELKTLGQSMKEWNEQRNN
jgi:hypothetical protein